MMRHPAMFTDDREMLKKKDIKKVAIAVPISLLREHACA